MRDTSPPRWALTTTSPSWLQSPCWLSVLSSSQVSSTLPWHVYEHILIVTTGSFIGFGVHVWVVDPRNAIPLLRFYWISQQLYILDQLLTKISLLALYLRVFPKRWINLTARYGIFVMVVQETIFYFVILLRCMPVSASWDIREKGRCLDLNAIGFAGAILGIAEHFAILVMPLPELWKLKLSKRKRIMLAFVFSLGSL